MEDSRDVQDLQNVYEHQPTTNWVRSRFVQDENGDKVECREGEAYIPFSVFDNPDIAFRQTYEAALNKIRDQATKERLLYGNWDFVEANDMAIYNSFDGSRHLVTGLKEKAYDPTKPLITVWDFNVAPQMSVLSAQIDYETGRSIYWKRYSASRRKRRTTHLRWHGKYA